MLGHCILLGGNQGNRGKTQALVDGNGPLQPATPQLAMTAIASRSLSMAVRQAAMGRLSELANHS